jgi:hypothetical protein
VLRCLSQRAHADAMRGLLEHAECAQGAYFHSCPAETQYVVVPVVQARGGVDIKLQKPPRDRSFPVPMAPVPSPRRHTLC